jgi:3',5'-nucleoside bisphosphate phosphatase
MRKEKMTQTKYIDLHTHTMYSDGIETPEILAENLMLNGINVAAITDHDNIEGYARFEYAAKDVGLTPIPGIEFSDKDYHILALGFNPYDKEFIELVNKSKYLQRLTTEQRVDLLKENGIPITLEKVDSNFYSARLGKHNVFRTLYRDKECRVWLRQNLPEASPDEVFTQLFRKGGIAAKVPHYYDLERGEIINGIHKAEGIAILAHGPKDLESVRELDELREAGIDGFEIQPNFYDKTYFKVGYPAVEEYTNKHDMILTHGSDYHGPFLPRRLLGRGKNILTPRLEALLLKDYERMKCKEKITR